MIIGVREDRRHGRRAQAVRLRGARGLRLRQRRRGELPDAGHNYMYIYIYIYI